MCADVVLMRYDLDQKSKIIQILHHRLSGLITVHTRILATELVDGRIVVHNVDLRKIVALSHLKIVRIMSRRDLYAAGTKLFVYICVRDNRDLTVRQRKLQHFSDQILITLVIRIDCHCGITKQSLRTGRCDLDESALFPDNRIIDVPEISGLIHMLNLGIRNGCLADRTPVDDPGSLINITFFIKADKHLLHSLRASLVHCETLAVPICRCTELFQLIDNLSAVLFLPCPCMLQKFLTADLILINALLFELCCDLYLSCNRRMVCSRLPQRLIALHPFEPDQNILHRLVQRMAHMQLSGNVWRRDHDGKRLLVRIYLRMKILFIQPFLIQSVFQALRVIGLCQFFAHKILLCVVM